VLDLRPAGAGRLGASFLHPRLGASWSQALAQLHVTVLPWATLTCDQRSVLLRGCSGGYGGVGHERTSLQMPFSCGCCLESRWWSHWCSSGGGTRPLPPCFLLQTPPPATCRCIYEWIYIFLVWFSFFFLKCHCLELNHLVCSECYFNRAARKTGVPLQNQEPQTMSCVPGNGRKESHSDQL